MPMLITDLNNLHPYILQWILWCLWPCPSPLSLKYTRKPTDQWQFEKHHWFHNHWLSYVLSEKVHYFSAVYWYKYRDRWVSFSLILCSSWCVSLSVKGRSLGYFVRGVFKMSWILLHIIYIYGCMYGSAGSQNEILVTYLVHRICTYSLYPRCCGIYFRKLNPLSAIFFQREHKHIFTFYAIAPR